jgi:hypothetical protein
MTPTPAEALDMPLAAFPSWFLRVTSNGCGKERMFCETRVSQCCRT